VAEIPKVDVFQFLIGRLAMEKMNAKMTVEEAFQFLIGRLAILKCSNQPSASIQFQFLIGRLAIHSGHRLKA